MVIDMRFKDLTATEAQMMNVLWEHGEDMLVSELTEEILRRYDRDHKRTTMATYLQRLIDKGYITTYRIRKFAYVHAEITEARYKELVAESQVDHLYNGKFKEFMASFYGGRGFTKEEIEELKEFLDDLDD